MNTAKEVAASLVKRNVLTPAGEMSLGRNADHMQQVIGFHSTYGVPTSGLSNPDPKFEHMSDERVGLRLGLISEEFAELFEKGFGITVESKYVVEADGTTRVFTDHGMKTGKALDAAHRAGQVRNGVEVADALGDLIYVIYGFALEMGYDLRAVVEEIHASNLTKLGADGKPIYRDDGKVLKGPNYREPNLPAVLGFEP